MKIRIDPKELTESPYTFIEDDQLQNDSEENKEQPAQDVEKSESPVLSDIFRDDVTLKNLADELINSNPTSLLISGFRGAGKTSFIERIQEYLRDNPPNDNREIVFVKLNFSKYEEHRFVIRKLIRNLYLSISDKQVFKQLQEEQTEEKKLNGAQKLESLYKKTYLDVQTQLKIKNESTREVKTEISVAQKIGLLVEAILGLGATATVFTNLQYALGNYAVGGLFAVFTVLKAIQFKQTITKKEVTTEGGEKVEKTIYDDEIADFLFHDLLKSLKNRFRLVFVLDELDKIQDGDEIDKVINELKPFLLSGSCNFILVSGQDLYYRFFNASFESDPVLSSIFSRTHHIELPQNLITLVDHFVTQNSQGKGDGDFFYDLQRSLVFDSNRIPRKLMANIRQLISRANWLEKEEVFELELTSKDRELLTRNKILEEAIAGIIPAFAQDKILENNPPLKDLFISQLYIWANKLFLLEDGIHHEKQKFLNDEEPWTSRLSNLKAKREVYLELFLNDLVRKGFITLDEKTESFELHWDSELITEEASSQKTETRKTPQKSGASVQEIPELPNENLVAEQEGAGAKNKARAAKPEKENFEAKPVQKRTPSKRDQADFKVAYDNFITLASKIYKTLADILDSKGAIDQAEEPYKTLDPSYRFSFEDLGLYFRIENIVNDKHQRLILKIKDAEDPYVVGSAADAVEFQRMQHSLLIGYLMTIPEMLAHQEFVPHWSESVSFAEKRIPNIDLLLESTDITYSTIGFKVIVTDEPRVPDGQVINECVDFMRRLNNITEKANKVMILIFTSATSGHDPDLNDYLNEEVRKELTKNGEFIPYLQVGVYDLLSVGKLPNDVMVAQQDELLSFSRSFDLETQDGAEALVSRGSFGVHMNISGEGRVKILLSEVLGVLDRKHGNLWLEFVCQSLNEVDIALIMELYDQEAGTMVNMGLLLKTEESGPEAWMQFDSSSSISSTDITPDQRLILNDKSTLYRYNIYDAIEKYFWKRFLLRGLLHFEFVMRNPKSKIEIAYFKFHFDVEDTTYQGLGLLTD